jgi:hypothetical protein
MYWMSAAKAILSGLRPSRPVRYGAHMPPATWNLVQACWKQDARDRPTATQVLAIIGSRTKTSSQNASMDQKAGAAEENSASADVSDDAWEIVSEAEVDVSMVRSELPLEDNSRETLALPVQSRQRKPHPLSFVSALNTTICTP